MLKQKLDHEQNKMISFAVLARDNGNPIQSSLATVEVTVLDVNDNQPVFNTYNKIYNVAENAVQGTSVATVAATDADSGDFGRLYYTLQVTNDDGCFIINKWTVSTYRSMWKFKKISWNSI